MGANVLQASWLKVALHLLQCTQKLLLTIGTTTGSRITLSEKQYKANALATLTASTDPKQRQAIASAHEQKRLAGIFGSQAKRNGSDES